MCLLSGLHRQPSASLQPCRSGVAALVASVMMYRSPLLRLKASIFPSGDGLGFRSPTSDELTNSMLNASASDQRDGSEESAAPEVPPPARAGEVVGPAA